MDKTIRYVAPGDEFKHELAADVGRAQAANKRKLAELARSAAAEYGEDIDTTSLEEDAEQKEAEAERHRDSARMIRQHFREERARGERARAHGPARSKARARGAGRPKAQSTRSSARSGDSGDDGESSSEGESSGPAARRLCAFCGKDLPPKRRKYCTEKHADRDRAASEATVSGRS